MLFGKSHELVGNTSEWIQLKRMFARTRLEKLIETLLQIDRRSAGQVIQIVTLAIPRQRRPHRRAVTSMEKIVGPGKVLLLREGRRCVAKVWRVIIEKFPAKLPRSTTGKRDPHRRHRLHGRRFHSQKSHSPFGQRVRKRRARSRLRRQHLFPHRPGLGLERCAPLSRQRTGIKTSKSIE